MWCRFLVHNPHTRRISLASPYYPRPGRAELRTQEKQELVEQPLPDGGYESLDSPQGIIIADME
jgi:hypothetical protein